MGIHSTVPETMRQKGLDPRMLAYRLEQLLPRMRGRENAMTSDQIMRALGFTPSKTNESLRVAAKLLFHEKSIPLASNNSGFWLARTSAECRECRDLMNDKAMSLLKNVKKWNDILDKWASTQGSLFGEEL